jgi:23S rRNA C2498 (ribose-2'-O)-methylase RlmM
LGLLKECLNYNLETTINKIKQRIMIKGNNIANLTDRSGKNDVEVEINKKKQKDSVELRIKSKDSKEWLKSDIPIQELYSLVVSLVSGEQLDDLMPEREIKVRVYERQHKIELLRDMKKGEIVVANFKVEVPIDINDDIKIFAGKDYKVQIKELK